MRARELAPACTTCKKTMAFKQMRPMELRTCLTGVPQTVQSPYWQCRDCHRGAMGLRLAMDPQRDGITQELRELAAIAGVNSPFEEASDKLLRRMAGLSMRADKVYGICQEIGNALMPKMETGQLGETRKLRPNEVLYVLGDGGMLQHDGGWKEAKLFIVLPSMARSEVSRDRRQLTERQIIATMKSADKCGPMLWEAVRKWLPKDEDGNAIINGNVAFLSDGSEWLNGLCEEWLPGARKILDWYHASEHVAETARVLFADETDDQKAFEWREHKMELLRSGAVSEALGELLIETSLPGLGAESKEQLPVLRGYLVKRRVQTEHPAARSRGLDIGSGVIESGVGHVMQQRMKRSGIRRSHAGSPPMLALRAGNRVAGGLNQLADAPARPNLPLATWLRRRQDEPASGRRCRRVVDGTMQRLLLFFAVVSALAAPAWAKGPPVPEVHAVDYRLPNGMRVILHADRSTPLVAVDVWYDVGSGDEVPGRSGFAHLFEHMMFQGSRHTGEDQHFNLLRKAGASNVNGTTNTDRTNYYEVLPSNQLETALWLESDRMAWLPELMSQKSLDNQRDVVRNERRQRYDNAPYGKERFALSQLLYDESHPYRYLTIGRHEDLEAAKLPDVQAFFDKWYAPSNATVCIAGDFDEPTARRLVEKWFASFPKMQRPVHVLVPPSRVEGPRRQEVEDPFARLRRVHFAWHSPAHFAMGDAELDILAHVLGAPGTGRLDKLLVHDKQWAQSVSVDQASARMSSVFNVIVDLRPEADVVAVEGAVLAEIARVCTEPISAAELRRAVVAIESGFVWGLESLFARADMLQQYGQMLGKPNGFALDLQRYRDATSAGVLRYARAALSKRGRVEVVTLPAGPAGAPPPPTSAPAAITPTGGQ